MPSYAASKARVHAYTEALRAQLATAGITVTELVPAAVATAGQKRDGRYSELVAMRSRMVPMVA